MEMIPGEHLPRIARCEPQAVNVVPGKIYSWCTCGLSKKQPFCDGSHKCLEPVLNDQGEKVLPYRSLKIEFEKEETLWFCQCKQTKNPPFCDGSHKELAMGNLQ